MTTAQDIIDRAKTIGIEANTWTSSTRGLRIYAKTSRRDMKVYLDCDGSVDDIEGAKLQVFCNTPQHPNWVKSQINDFKKMYIGLFYSYVVEKYKETPMSPNGYGPDINQMIIEAQNHFRIHNDQ